MSESRSLPFARQQPPATFIGTRLNQFSTALVIEWCGGKPSGAVASTSHVPADPILLANVTTMVESVARYVMDPAFEVRRNLRAQLRERADAWHQLECSARELVVWLDELCRLIMQRMQQETTRFEPAADVKPTTAALVRLSEGLREMTSLILELHLDRELARRRESAQQQTDANLVFAHELRAPLHTISLSASILEAPDPGVDPNNRQRQFKIIRSALAHAESLLQHADLVKGSEGAQPPGITTSLASVFESVAEELSARATASGVELRISDAVPPLSVETVVAHLVLSNLLINAIKYSDDTKEARWVSVQAEVALGDDARFVTVEVADNGIGVPASLQQHLFQRKFRAHPHVAGGVGLGLAIAREVLTDRGGSIDLISQEQVGTSVRFRMPASPVGPE